ncbi:aliphatic sulfonate ABC transporter substrate-binding protein [Alkalicoccus chagannorensis]|uniref:aliphatic sulfonate ABC transporter substrate-binding protein n=1 Tax=Alkalicoccus chagannorensis TaxID=427072 RepID=UPI0003F9B12C|nr:aliphatic sulfonate ABC transporter substrate-binding protein [Alkalicoccus chagannorensis]
MRNYLLTLTAGAAVLAGCGDGNDSGSGADASSPETITVDYAYYSPTSLVLKEQGFLDEVFEDEDVEFDYVLSQGSNNALEFLSGGSVDFGSTAGAAALMAKGNDSPIKNVYIYSQPEWTALVTGPESDVASVEDLEGKQVAATLGTDPYIFLVRALDEAGLSEDDVEIVPVQHNDGANLLANGEVDAWAGLDPHMARQELENDAELFYRNEDFNTYGFLNVREDFAEEHPEAVEKVIEAYELAREWTLDNPDDVVDILVAEAGIDEETAELQLERNNFDQPLPGTEHEESLAAAGEVLQSSGNMEEDDDVEALLEELIDPSYAENVIEQ